MTASSDARTNRAPNGTTTHEKSGRAAARGPAWSRARHVNVGDEVVIERRYVVDGALTSVTDKGRFRGVQLLGSSEHVVLERGKKGDVRMIPLHTISEIALKGRATAPVTDTDGFDPGFA